jgi:uncharacterized protein (TIGR02996 family)
MTDRAALVARVLSNPEDSAPLLIYADFVEEKGDEPLAAAIRQKAAVIAERWAALDEATGRLGYCRCGERVAGGQKCDICRTRTAFNDVADALGSLIDPHPKGRP